MRTYNPELFEAVEHADMWGLTRILFWSMLTLLANWVIIPIAVAILFSVPVYVPYVVLLAGAIVQGTFTMYMKNKALEANHGQR